MSGEMIRTTAIKPVPNAFCPGCLHSMASKLIGESLEELGLIEKNRYGHSGGLLDYGAEFLEDGYGERRARPRSGGSGRDKESAA